MGKRAWLLLIVLGMLYSETPGWNCSHLNIFRKAHYHLKAKETNEWWRGKSLWRWVKGAADITLKESF